MRGIVMPNITKGHLNLSASIDEYAAEIKMVKAVVAIKILPALTPMKSMECPKQNCQSSSLPLKIAHDIPPMHMISWEITNATSWLFLADCVLQTRVGSVRKHDTQPIVLTIS